MALQAVAECLGLKAPDLSVRGIERGVTHDTFLVEAGGAPLAVLRFAPGDSTLLPGLKPGGEGELIRSLPPGVRAPEVLLTDADGSVLGRPGIAFRYVPGANPQSWQQLRSVGGEPAAEDALQVLIRLHNDGLDGALRRHCTEISAADFANSLVGDAARFGTDAPEQFRTATRALAGAAPAAPGPACLVHGDFRPANLVVGKGLISAVLDWEMAALGDPTRDLGIATMAAWGRWWPDADLLRRYRDGGGHDLDPVALLWWRCLSYALVVRFMTRARLAGRQGSAALDGFAAGLATACAEWEAARS
jgi:aminoglycoside phosphotransferase (APT) family kinase protein